MIFTYIQICPTCGSVLCCVLHLAMSGAAYQEMVKAENNVPGGLSRAPEVGNNVCCHLVTTWPSGACYSSPGTETVVVQYTLAKEP